MIYRINVQCFFVSQHLVIIFCHKRLSVRYKKMIVILKIIAKSICYLHIVTHMFFDTNTKFCKISFLFCFLLIILLYLAYKSLRRYL